MRIPFGALRCEPGPLPERIRSLHSSLCRHSTIVAVMMAFSLSASAQDRPLPEEGLYIGLSSGATVAEDSELTGAGIDIDGDHQTGWNLSGAVGYNHGQYRTEFEIGVLRNRIDAFRAGSGGGLLPEGQDLDGNGRSRVLTYMSNIYYDLDEIGGDVRPYIGAGAGWASIDFNRFRTDSGQFLDDDDGEFVYQLSAGVRKPVGRLVLDAGYRFLDTTRATVAVREGTRLKADYTGHSFRLGLTYHFGAIASDAPSAPAAPAQEPEQEPVEPEAVDSDHDGVPDHSDNCPDTPRNYAVDDEGCPIPNEEVARIELNVNFDLDCSEVQEQYYPEIERLASFLEEHPDTTATLEGHTDSTGTEEYNLGLSKRRVDAIRQVLIDEHDIAADRIDTVGHGESRPVASNDTADGRARNRRVVSLIETVVTRYEER